MNCDVEILYNFEFTVELLIAEMLFVRGSRVKNHIVVRLLCSVIFCCIVTLLFSYDKIMLMANHYAINILLMFRFFLILIISMAGIRICVYCTNEQVFLWGICAYMMQNMAFSVSDGINAIRQMVQQEGASPEWVEIGLRILIFALVYSIAWKVFGKKIHKLNYTFEQRTATVLGAGMLFLVIALSTQGHDLEPQTQIWFRVMEVLGCVLGFAVVVALLNKQQLELELSAIQQQAEMQSNYYTLLKDNIEITNIRCHDVKHLIMNIRNKLNENGLDCENTLSKLENTITIYDSVAKTGNPALDTVLTEKSLICARNGIRFTYMVDSEKIQIFEADDIYNLFGNALDNAIEACKKVQDHEKRVMNLTAICKGPFLVIDFYNYYDGVINMEEGLPKTSKIDTSFHGYGIKSIQMIVKKNDGEMTILCEDNIFDLNIVIPLYKMN